MDPAGCFICGTKDTSEGFWKEAREVTEPRRTNLKDSGAIESMHIDLNDSESAEFTQTNLKDSETEGDSGLGVISKFQPHTLVLLEPFKWTETKGVRLTVAFLKDPKPFEPEVRTRILWHMNSWSEFCNVLFIEEEDPAKSDVRITRYTSGGFQSYVGTKIREHKNEPTMNLAGFGPETEDSQYRSVVRHETGHTLGFVHEHLRPDIVQNIDKKKAAERYYETNRWNSTVVQQQVFDNLKMDAKESNDSKTYFATPSTDVHSIMCYPLHPMIMVKDAPYIPGGVDFSELDQEHANRVYPKSIRLAPRWNILDNNLAATDIIATSGYLYQRRNDNSTWSYRLTGETQEVWKPIDNDKSTVQLAADGENLYRRARTGQVFMYQGNPVWKQISDSILTIDIIASAGKLYRWDSDMSLFKYSKESKSWSNVKLELPNDRVQLVISLGKLYVKSTTEVYALDEEANVCRQIAVTTATELIASDRKLYRRDRQGGTFVLSSSNPTAQWSRVCKDAYATQVVADGDQLYFRHNDGRIFVWTASSNVRDGEQLMEGTWKQIDGNVMTRKIAVAGGRLYKLHNNGTISVYN